MASFENQVENLNILHDLSAFLFHLGSTDHKSQTLLCSCFIEYSVQDKSVFTREVSSQLMLN